MARPNILIFMTDHQRADTAAPAHRAITPHLDAFARQGVTLSQTYCPSPHCCPSRATFHSGLYPSRHGVWNNVCNAQALSRGPRPGVRLWSEDLAEAGYRLAWSGKWHVSAEQTPKERGWHEELFVSGQTPREHQTDWTHYERLASQPVPSERGEGQILRPGYGTYTLYGTSDKGNPHDEQAVARAIDIMPRLARAGQPWCLFVGLTGPHDPYRVPSRFLDLYRLDDVPLPPSHADRLDDKPRIYKRMRDMRFGQLSDREVRQAIRHFLAYCSYLDDLFGRVLKALDETGQAAGTLVLYTADHGDYCGDHGLFAKGIPCFRGAYHVPAVVRWPDGVKQPGRRVDEFVSLADFGPTFLDLAGIKTDRPMSGASLMPFLRGERPNQWRDDIHTQCNGVELYYTQRSVMTRQFKYVFNGFDADELYDLEADPHEMVNLAGQGAMEPIKRNMCRRMWRFARREEDTAINAYITTGLAPYGPAEAWAT